MSLNENFTNKKKASIWHRWQQPWVLDTSFYNKRIGKKGVTASSNMIPMIWTTKFVPKAVKTTKVDSFLSFSCFWALSCTCLSFLFLLTAVSALQFIREPRPIFIFFLLSCMICLRGLQCYKKVRIYGSWQVVQKATFMFVPWSMLKSKSSAHWGFQWFIYGQIHKYVEYKDPFVFTFSSNVWFESWKFFWITSVSIHNRYM